jgi:hypothetical protein
LLFLISNVSGPLQGKIYLFLLFCFLFKLVFSKSLEIILLLILSWVNLWLALLRVICWKLCTWINILVHLILLSLPFWKLLKIIRWWRIWH